ncbi:MAG: hypothetical protein V4598_06375 [Bdellovibrionota bacterium]
MFFILLLCSNLWALEPTGYDKKSELKAASEISGSQISFQYGFKNLKGEYQEWTWQDDYLKLRDLTQQFGISGNDANAIESGLFTKHPLVGIIPDYNKLISIYQGTVVEIYRHWKREVENQKLNRRESVELLLRFLQDFPYGIPPSKIGQKFIGGLLVPPLSLESGWADCDSKSLMMATILSFDPYFRDKLAMILVPGHALLGIEGIPQTYDEFYEYRNRNYVVAEPTGLSRTPFGKRNSPYSTLIALIPLSGPESAPGAISPAASSGLQPLTQADCPEGGLLVEIFSKIENAKMQVCMMKVGESYIKNGPLLKYDSAGRPKEKEFYIQDVKR